MPDRKEAWELLCEYTKGDSLRKHAVAVETAMRACAKRYGAPDADLRAEYNFFPTTDGSRRLFNRMEPQLFGDADLPPPQPWTNQAFAMQSVSLKSFPPGQYELEVVMRDRLTRASATGSVAFTVGVR